MDLSGLKFPSHFEFIFLNLFIVIAHVFEGVTSQRLKRFDDIRQWALREEQIYELSKARVNRLKAELNELEGYVEDYEKTTSQHLSNIKNLKLQETLKTSEEARAYHVASDPMLTYRMAHRLATMIPKMQRVGLSKDLNGTKLKELLGTFTDLREHPNVTLEQVGKEFGQYSELLPNEDDLEGALDAITVLYDVYNPEILEPSNFVQVLSPETFSPSHINAYHATKFSLKAFYHGYYGNAWDWATYAYSKLENERDYSISKELVHYMREFMKKSHNEEIMRRIDTVPEPMSFLNFYSSPVDDIKAGIKRKSDIAAFESMAKKRSNQYFDKESVSFLLDNFFYYSACQKSLLREELPSKLECTLSRSSYPYNYLAPLKLEKLSETPRIMQFHEILSDQEIGNILKEVEDQKFESSYPLNQFPDEYGSRVPHMQTTMNAVISKEIVESGGKTGVLRRLARKTEHLTGFQRNEDQYGTVCPAEKRDREVDFKVMEFVGGGYEAFSKITKKLRFGGGAQIFLRTPAAGGELVFGGAKGIAKPTKGSIVVWDSIKSDMDLYVGSCPVLQGQKLVLSKDFYYSSK